MKKLIFTFAFAIGSMLVSCNTNKTTNDNSALTDSTVVDSAAADSTVIDSIAE